MESDTDRDDTKESMDQSTSESLQSGSPTVISLLDRRAYKEVLALKKSSIEYHMKFQKHISGKKKLALASKEESRIQKALHVYDSRTRLVGDGLPDSTRVY